MIARKARILAATWGNVEMNYRKLALCSTAVITFLCLFQMGMAQRETHVWCFGDSVGMDFIGGGPVPFSGTGMFSQEGVSSIADSNGNLLIYSNGSRVYGADHQIMPNGNLLLGSQSSSQSSVIVPRPGSSHIYDLFTITMTGLYHSEINMLLNGGLGDVTGNKNVQVVFGFTNLMEKVCAVHHANEHDVWVLARATNSNTFISLLVSDTGVSQSPVLSYSGLTYTPYRVGQMKVSPLGNKLAMSVYRKGVEIHDFDNNTGLVSNAITWTPADSLLYGAEFSPDGQYLYTSNWNNAKLIQYDVNAGNNISTSGVLIHDAPRGGSLQLAPDGRLYFARDWLSKVSCIQNPNAWGLACGFVDIAVPFPNPQVRSGLPNFISSYFRKGIHVSNTCQGDTTAFWIPLPSHIDSISWNFDDPGPGNISTALKPTHVFSGPGIYNVSVVLFNNNVPLDTLSKMIEIYPLPVIDIGSDSILCSGDSLTVSSNSPLQMTYLWSDSSTASFFPVTTPGTYWVEVTNLCGIAHDTITIDSVLPATIDLGLDTVFCIGDSITLDITVPYGNYYLWSDSSTSPQFTIDTTGVYWAIAANPCMADTDSIVVQVPVPPTFPFPSESVVCHTDTLQIWVNAQLASYLWSDSSTNSSIGISTPGIHWVQATNVCGTFSDTIKVLHDKPLQIDLGADTVVCDGESYILDPHTPRTTHYWFSGFSDSTQLVDHPDVYWLKGVNTCGTFKDTVWVEYEVPPVVDLGADSILCDGNKVGYDVSFSRASYQWNTGDTVATVEVNQSGTWKVTVTNLCGTAIDSVALYFDVPLSVSLGPDIDTCLGETLALAVNFPATTSYQWSTGERTPAIAIGSDGVYAVTATNTCGSYADSLVVYFLPPPTVSIDQPKVLCAGVADTLLLVEQSYVTYYQWSTGSVDSITIVDQPGNYQVEVSNRCGTAFDEIWVENRSLPYVELGKGTSVCESLQTTFLLETGGNPEWQYVWNDNSTEGELLVTQAGIYSVTVTDTFGCRNSDKVIMGGCPISLYIPSAFTPNGDGINDVFQVKAQDLQHFEMEIYNRWGQLIFQTKDLQESWDGTYLGEEAPKGVYAWRMEYKGENTVLLEQSGWVVLER